MKLIFIGDVVGYGGCSILWDSLCAVKREYGADIVVVNGENSAVGNGISVKSAEHILRSGADVVTTGNHCFRKKDCAAVFEKVNVLRPVNYPKGVMGYGVYTAEFGRKDVAFVNLMGVTYMEPIDNPFSVIDEILPSIKTPNIFVDFHAEATAEKKTMGYYLAGRVTAVFGTHTHVQTNDERILKNHTGYITDAGMTGSEDSVLGVDTELAIRRQVYHIPVQFTESDKSLFMCGVCVEFDESTGKCISIEKFIKR